MLRAVIFDLDGTLIDSTQAILDGFFHIFDTIGEARPAAAKIFEGIGAPFEEEIALLTQHDPGECTRIYRKYYNETACEKTQLMPGAVACLEALGNAGMRLAFATSKQQQSAEMLLGHLGVLDHFDACIDPGDVTHPKPHPEAVLAALEKLGATEAEALFVGDMHFDALAAQTAGVRCVLVTTGYEPRARLAALPSEGVYDHLDEVCAHILTHRDAPSMKRSAP